MKAFLSLVLLLGSIGFSAQASFNFNEIPAEPDPEKECSEIAQRIGLFQIHRYQGAKSCLFSALPMNDQPFYYHYRSPLFTDEGTFMIFNSYEGFNVADGARSFTIFPRNRLPNLEIVDGRAVMKSATVGFELILDNKKTIVFGMNGAKFTEDYDINPNNAGGIEISDVQTLYLDSGFMELADPTTDLSRKSVFKDIKGKTCRVTNREIFKDIGKGDTAFKFSDSELKVFLAWRCPKIFVNF